ncbi:hypothetical protein [Acidiferrobacter sp.]|nr:hypothetical protein [Acidiferrobacter sp.]
MEKDKAIPTPKSAQKMLEKLAKLRETSAVQIAHSASSPIS